MARDLTDLFGGSSSIKLNSRWNVNQFLSNPGNYRSTPSSSVDSTGMSADTKVELERAIKAIEMSYSKSSLDFDKIFRDLATRRKELKALMTELQATAKPVDIAAMWSVESSLIVNQLRALENKQKIESEKFKQIRDEKKLAKEKTAPVAETTGNNNGVTNIITNSPLATANNLANGITPKNNGITIGDLPSSAIVKTASMFKQDKPEDVQVIEHTEPIPIPTPNREEEPIPAVMEETTAEQTVVATPSVSNTTPVIAADGDIVVTSDNIGNNVVTVNDIQSDINNRVSQRLLERDSILKNEKTITGYNYQHSLDTMVSKSMPHVEKLYICPHDGTYYTKAFTKDENGNFTKEIPNFPLKSITHIGQLSLNPLHKKATFYYYPDAKDYELVDDFSGAPEFYKKEWEDPKTEKFRLDTDTCQSLIDAE